MSDKSIEELISVARKVTKQRSVHEIVPTTKMQQSIAPVKLNNEETGSGHTLDVEGLQKTNEEQIKRLVSAFAEQTEKIKKIDEMLIQRGAETLRVSTPSVIAPLFGAKDIVLDSVKIVVALDFHPSEEEKSLYPLVNGQIVVLLDSGHACEVKTIEDAVEAALNPPKFRTEGTS